MTRILVILLFALTSFQEENASGIYIVNKPPKKTSCDHELKTVIGQVKICLSKKPIISIDEVDYVTQIKYDPVIESHYVDIGFTSAGMSTLTKTFNSLPNSQFALVVEGDVVCLFAVREQMVVRSVRIGQDAQLKDLETIHAILSKIKT